MNSQVVAAHYNARPQIRRNQRKESPIYQLKAFNNWIKSVWIAKYCHRNDRVLDMACGKGGDLLKWSKQNVKEVIGVDIAAVSVEHARQRYSEGNFRFDAKFYVLDCYGAPLSNIISPEKQFDLVSIQFAFHYSFASERNARIALKNVSGNLVPGGYFIGTIPNANRIIKNIKESKQKEFGNSVFKIIFDQIDTTPCFGHKYTFDLVDAVSDCPEFVINFQVLTKLAAEYNLEPVEYKGFHEIYVEEVKNQSSLQLLHRMGVLKDGTISDDEWEAIGLYSAFAFRKI